MMNMLLLLVFRAVHAHGHPRRSLTPVQKQSETKEGRQVRQLQDVTEVGILVPHQGLMCFCLQKMLC
jgi:hypothetical protein